jgi:HSP20 family protein
MGNGSKQRSVIVREGRLPGPLGWPEEFMGRAMRGFWPRRRLAWPALFREALWVPEMDVFEREGKTVVRVDVPGINREDIDVAVEGDTLVIRGRREEEKEIKEEDYYCAERAVGEFSRAISLPEGVRPEEIEATCQDGVLEVVIPRPAPAETASTKIEVR